MKGNYHILLSPFIKKRDDNFQNFYHRQLSEFLSLCNEIYEKGKWPQDFTETVMLPVPKKNNAQKCNEFRTINLISHLAKILLRILNRCLYSKRKES